MSFLSTGAQTFKEQGLGLTFAGYSFNLTINCNITIGIAENSPFWLQAGASFGTILSVSINKELALKPPKKLSLFGGPEVRVSGWGGVIETS